MIDLDEEGSNEIQGQEQQGHTRRNSRGFHQKLWLHQFSSACDKHFHNIGDGTLILRFIKSFHGEGINLILLKQPIPELI